MTKPKHAGGRPRLYRRDMCDRLIEAMDDSPTTASDYTSQPQLIQTQGNPLSLRSHHLFPYKSDDGQLPSLLWKPPYVSI